MTDEEREKKTRIANMLIGEINVFTRPSLESHIEKDVAKEALENYIKMLKQQPCDNCISRKYIEPIVEELENICINGDEHILLLLSNIKNAPPVTPQQTEQEEAEEKQEEKKVESIEDKTWLNFNAILAIYSYYEKALEDITKEPIPPCFNSICDPKYLKFALDGLEDAMTALTMLYKNILERNGTYGE